MVSGNFVEPVQLQVVCRNLWDELPGGIEEITEQHLLSFGDVNTALSAFYENELKPLMVEFTDGLRYAIKRHIPDDETRQRILEEIGDNQVKIDGIAKRALISAGDLEEGKTVIHVRFED